MSYVPLGKISYGQKGELKWVELLGNFRQGWTESLQYSQFKLWDAFQNKMQKNFDTYQK